MTDDRTLIERAFDRFGIAAAVVTVLDGDRRHGSTGMAWAEQVDPPLVLTTLRRSGTTRRLIESSGAFGINLLGSDRSDLVWRFAGPGDRFADVPTIVGPRLGVPLIEGCVARFECEVTASHPFGEHDIVIGRVAWHDVSAEPDIRPVVHYSGELWRLESASAVTTNLHRPSTPQLPAERTGDRPEYARYEGRSPARPAKTWNADHPANVRGQRTSE